MIINGVKITLIICLTIIVSAVLIISYNEYSNRYSMITTGEDSVYIFDKKSTVLNKCSEKGCKFIETIFPENTGFSQNQFSPSKMFGAEKSMNEAISKTEAQEKQNNPEKVVKAPESENKKNEQEKKTEEKESTSKKTEETSEDEFIE